MPIRLLAVDMDGTLLTSNRIPHPDGIEAIRRASALGISVVLASGRIRTSMIPFAEEMGLRGPMISSNGAYIEDTDGREIAFFPLPMAVLDAVYPYVVEVGAHLNVYTPTEIIYLQESPFGIEYAKRLKTMTPRIAPIEEVRKLRICKILVMDHPDNITVHRRVLERRVDPSLGEATVSEPDYLEFLATGVSKGKALSLLCRDLGIQRQETAAIGDYLNDREMLEWAHLSAIVENGHQELRSTAQHVVRSNDDGGVAEFIDRYVLNGWNIPA